MRKMGTVALRQKIRCSKGRRDLSWTLTGDEDEAVLPGLDRWPGIGLQLYHKSHPAGELGGLIEIHHGALESVSYTHLTLPTNSRV